MTLAKYVVQAVPTYVMQAEEFPRGICDEVDKLRRRFIWGEEAKQRKVHLLNWEKMCKPKKYGCLGFRFTRKMNSAFMLKGVRNFFSNPDSFWGCFDQEQIRVW